MNNQPNYEEMGWTVSASGIILCSGYNFTYMLKREGDEYFVDRIGNNVHVTQFERDAITNETVEKIFKTISLRVAGKYGRTIEG